MLGNVGSAISRSGVFENVRVAVGVALLSPSVHELSLGPVSTCRFLGSRPPFWYFRYIDTQGNDVILYGVHLDTRQFKLHFSIWSRSGDMVR